jgi:hypothetical protein
MQHRIAIGIALTIAALPMPTIAQVANGTFESGLGSWSLRDATFQHAVGRTCANAAYAPSKRSSTTKALSPAAGRVARVTPDVLYTPGSWALCSELEQTIYVPMGKQLKFVARVGEGIHASRYQIESGALSVVVVAGGKSTTLFSQNGHNIECLNGQWPCPAYRTHVLNMSPYWGKTVRLIFRGGSSVRNGRLGGISYPSHAYIDNVRIE